MGTTWAALAAADLAAFNVVASRRGGDEFHST